MDDTSNINKKEISQAERLALITRIELMDKELSSLKESIGMQEKPFKDSLVTVFSILAAAIIVGGSLAYSSHMQAQKSTNTQKQEVTGIDAMRAVSKDDHIIGSIDAPVKIVEYSDPECPFCKIFHQTMIDIMKKYGTTGQVAWVYRHLPLESLHAKAVRESHALECASDEKGNDGFWQYATNLYAITPSNDGLPLEELNTIASRTGLSLDRFKKCMTDMKFLDRITRDRDEAVRIGADGTPFSVVIAPDGTKTPIFGAQKYEQVDKIIAAALAKK